MQNQFEVLGFIEDSENGKIYGWIDILEEAADISSVLLYIDNEFIGSTVVNGSEYKFKTILNKKSKRVFEFSIPLKYCDDKKHLIKIKVCDKNKIAYVPYGISRKMLMLSRPISLYKKKIKKLKVEHNNIKVSVIIPVFNVEKYLEKALESVVNQTLEDIEIIIVNDGSTDNSGAICDHYNKQHNNIKYINLSENSGYGRACNEGIYNAKGRYIGILEPDDFIDPDAYKYAYEQTKEVDIDIVRFGFSLYDEGKIKESTYNKVLNDLKVPSNIVFHVMDYPDLLSTQPTVWGFLYRRQFLIENTIKFQETPGASFQDVSFYFKILALSNNAIFLKNLFYFYRQHPEQSIHNKSKLDAPINELNEIKKFCENIVKLRFPNIYRQVYLQLVHRALGYANYNGFHIKRLSNELKWSFYDKIRAFILSDLLQKQNRKLYYNSIKKHLRKILELIEDANNFKEYSSKYDLTNTKIEREFTVDNLRRPKVSIGIPLFKTERYLKNCLDSVINQSLKEIEIILVDDCSPDDSLKIAYNYKNNDKRIKVIKHNKNKGLGAVRNTCIDSANAPYICLIDSDDTISFDMLKTMYSKAIMHDVDMVVCGVKKTYEDEPKKITSFIKYDKEEVLKNCFHTYMTTSIIDPAVYQKLYKKEIFLKNKIRFPEHIFHQDIATMPQYIYYCNKILLLKEQLYFYHQRKGSAVTSASIKHIDSVCSMYKIVQNFLIEKGLYDRYKKNFFDYYFFNRALRSHFMRIANFSSSEEDLNRLFTLSCQEIVRMIDFEDLSSVISRKDIKKFFHRIAA